ncbi:MAG: hypothetical protein H7338_20350 [Candidatus Sericytochromatia bacterium]|nr:hypothetical protein [Candidatus Sericytochromatia bacterium]
MRYPARLLAILALVPMAACTIIVPDSVPASPAAGGSITSVPASPAAGGSITSGVATAVNSEGGERVVSKTKSKPTSVKQVGQTWDTESYSVTTPGNWIERDKPASDDVFTGLTSYGLSNKTYTGGVADISRGKFTFVSEEDDLNAAWKSIKKEWSNKVTYGATYVDNSGFTFTARFNGVSYDGYVAIIRRNSAVYFMEAYGDTKRLSETQAWSVINSFKLN